MKINQTSYYYPCKLIDAFVNCTLSSSILVLVWLTGLVTLNEMKAKQEDIVKERERQIAIGKVAEAHLSLDEAPNKARQAAARQVYKQFYVKSIYVKKQ